MILFFRCCDDDNRGRVELFVKDNICYTIRNDLSIFIPYVIVTLFTEITEHSNQWSNDIISNIY